MKLTLTQKKSQEQAVKIAELTAKNKAAALEQLLRISAILANQTPRLDTKSKK